MKIRKKSSNEERFILIGMIVDVTVLGRISSKWQNKMFKSRWANIISKWCVSYYRNYEEAPMNQIESLFESWSAEEQDKNIIKLVAKFLDSLSEEYETLAEESNSDYTIDIAGEYFNKVKLERLKERIEGDIDRGKSNKALDHVLSFDKIEMGVGEGINILQDTEAMKASLADKKGPIIQYPGDLGKFFMRTLERDGFIAFMGPEKRGKSFWLQDVAWRGMLQRRRVAYFEAGDQSQNQIMRRLMIRAAARPVFPKTIEYPTHIIKDGKYTVEVESEDRKFKGKLSWQQARKACEKVMQKKIKSKESYFRLSCHPNSTLSVNMISDTISNWTRDGWVPDIVIIDYADILLMNTPGLEGRDLINDTWKRLRSVSQKFHCLVVTATQADAASYDANIITQKNFSEDKRKLAHVTGIIGLNQTSDEKELGVMRLNWVEVRDEEFNEKRVVFVAGCLSIANPAIRSTF